MLTRHVPTTFAESTPSNAYNDEMAIGAITALQNAGYNKEGATVIPVFGVDATDAAKDPLNIT
mgnify:CR=1 FL=1